MVSIFDTLAAPKEDGQAAADVTSDVALQPELTHRADAELGVSTAPGAPGTFIPRDVKDAFQELLKFGFLEATRKPNLYHIAATGAAQINAILEPLDLALRIDDVRGLAFLVVAASFVTDAQDDEWSHPLIRRQRLTLEQSLLVALLRQHYLVHEQEQGIGAQEAPVLVEEVASQLQLYLGNLGSDTRELQRARNLLEKLKPHGIVSEVDQHDQFLIRPIIVHLANPENLQGLLQALKQASADARSDGDAESPPGEGAAA
ncbi:DUF4194 domain-containing protein [Ralstonia syzygii]|uniref:Conserved hypothethical protein n=1 Tax=Ralstonia syzygii R24 TaxID=907261 RepID=G3ACS8_9RALS|nr:conserved hypothethical protein [Ralstonia syzygii R24]